MIEWDEQEPNDNKTFAVLSALIVVIPAVGFLLSLVV